MIFVKDIQPCCSKADSACSVAASVASNLLAGSSQSPWPDSFQFGLNWVRCRSYCPIYPLRHHPCLRTSSHLKSGLWSHFRCQHVCCGCYWDSIVERLREASWQLFWHYYEPHLIDFCQFHSFFLHIWVHVQIVSDHWSLGLRHDFDFVFTSAECARNIGPLDLGYLVTVAESLHQLRSHPVYCYQPRKDLAHLWKAWLCPALELLIQLDPCW